MRRATKMTLLVMGGSAVTLGTIGLAQRGDARGCAGTPPPGAASADTRCDPSGGGHGGTGGSWGSRSAAADTAASARGGFGASGSAHAGE